MRIVTATSDAACMKKLESMLKGCCKLVESGLNMVVVCPAVPVPLKSGTLVVPSVRDNDVDESPPVSFLIARYAT